MKTKRIDRVLLLGIGGLDPILLEKLTADLRRQASIVGTFHREETAEFASE